MFQVDLDFIYGHRTYMKLFLLRYIRSAKTYLYGSYSVLWFQVYELHKAEVNSVIALESYRDEHIGSAAFPFDYRSGGNYLKVSYLLEYFRLLILQDELRCLS